MSFLGSLRRKLQLRSLERGDYSAEGERPESNVDAGAAAAAQNTQSAISSSAGPGYPPGYVKDYDDGRPRH
jgi:hypothetical protein